MENELIIIPEENIFLEFSIGNQMYAVVSDCTKLEEDGQIYFVKIDFLNEQNIEREANLITIFENETFRIKEIKFLSNHKGIYLAIFRAKKGGGHHTTMLV